MDRRSRRRVGSAPLLAVSLLAGLTTAARAADQPDAVGALWYQVEVVFFTQHEAHAPSAERVRDDVLPIWPPGTVALGPVHPQPVRPTSIDELAMQWDDAWTHPRMLQVTPGLTPEDETLIAWLRREDARGRTTGLEWRPGLESLMWMEPEPAGPEESALVGGAGAGDVAGDVAGEVAAADAHASAADADADTDPDAAGATAVPVPVSLAFRSVAPELRHLNDEVRRLERARNIRVLTHLAWRQPFIPEAPGIPVQVLHLDPGDEQPALLGTVAIDLRRFLHATLDLYWRVDAPDGDSAWSHVLENRRMRSAELHYVDHPHIGTLIRIERFALAEPLSADAPVVPLREEQD